MSSKTTPEDWKAIHTLAEACGVTSSTAQHWWIDGQVKYVAKPDMGYYEFQLQNEAGTVFAKKHCNGQVMTPGSVVYGKVIIPTTSTWAGIKQAPTKIADTKGFKLDTWSTDEGKPLPCKHCGSVKHLSKMCGKNFNPYPKKNFNSYPLCASCGMEAHPGQECPKPKPLPPYDHHQTNGIWYCQHGNSSFCCGGTMLLHCICEHGPETDGPEISCYVHGACEKCTDPAGGPFSVVHYAEHAAKDCPHHCYAHGKSKPCLDCWAVPGKCVHGNTHSACTECYMKNLCVHGKDKAKCSCSPSPNLTADAIKKMVGAGVIEWPKMHTMQAEKVDVAGYEQKTAHPGWAHIGYSQYSSGGIVPEPSDNPVGNTYPYQEYFGGVNASLPQPDGFVKMALGMDVPVAKMVITLANEPAWVCECTHPDCTTTGAYGEKIHEQRDFPHGSKGKQAAGEMRLHHIKVTGHAQAAVFERVKVHTPKPFVLTKEQENFLQQLWSSEFGGVTQKFIVGDGQLCQHHEVPGKCEECAKAAYLTHKKSYVCPHGHHKNYCSLCDEEKAKSKEELLAYKKKHEEKKAKYAETLAKLKKITTPVNVPTSDPVGMCTHGYQHWTCTHCKEESALAFAKFNELGKMLGMTPTAIEKAAKTKTLGQHKCCVHCSQVTHYAHTNGCPSQTSGGHTCTLDDHGPDSACEACNGVAEMKKPPKLVDPFANLEKAIGKANKPKLCSMTCSEQGGCPACEGELCLKCAGQGCMSCDGNGVV